MGDCDVAIDVKIDEKIEKRITEPPKYKVIFFNDNATPMEWVIEILATIFKHTLEASQAIMLQIHEEGSAVVGIYVYEIAEQKSVEATLASRDKGHPLQIKVEQE